MKPDLLIVDDAVDQLELMRSVFSLVDSSLRVITAKDGDEALRLLRDPETRPSVVLMDLRMPSRSGHEILSEIKGDPALRRIPVCTYSNGDIPSDVLQSYEGGASLYFRKPGGLEDLLKFAEQFKGIWFEFAALCA